MDQCRQRSIREAQRLISVTHLAEDCAGWLRPGPGRGLGWTRGERAGSPTARSQSRKEAANSLHIGGEPQRAHLFWHYAGNRFLSLLTNVLFNTTISDMEVGYKAFRTDLVRSLELTSDGFGIEPEITAKLLRLGCREFRGSLLAPPMPIAALTALILAPARPQPVKQAS